MNRRLAFVAAFALSLTGAAQPDQFGQVWDIEAGTGWASLSIPLEVYQACRPGLEDVRLFGASGQELPYAFESQLSSDRKAFALRDVESTSAETRALLDRGASPGWADSIELEFAAPEYMKVITVESSEDRVSWRVIGRGTAFRTASTASSPIRFPPNDRRWWRIRVDDRATPPVDLRRAFVEQPSAGPKLAVDAVVSRDNPEGEDWSSWTIGLPGPNLPVSQLQLSASEAAYARTAEVFESLWVRDELRRVQLGQGEIYRSGAGTGNDRVAIRSPRGATLTVEVQGGGGTTLHVTAAKAWLEPKTVIWHAPQGGSRLACGFQPRELAAPNYDLASAFRHGRPDTLQVAKLGSKVRDEAAAARKIVIARGAKIEPSDWQVRYPLTVPAQGEVSFVDVDIPESLISSVRIVDQQQQQVPYLVESTRRARKKDVAFEVKRDRGLTLLKVPSQGRAVERIELESSAPDFFDRRVEVYQRQGQTGRPYRALVGQGNWVVRPEERAEPYGIAISTLPGDLEVEIADGENAPVEVRRVAVGWSTVRLDFPILAGEPLELLVNNPKVQTPHYDLKLLAGRILSAPARASTLGPAQERPVAPTDSRSLRWFWIGLAIAGLLLGGLLAKTIRLG